MKSKHALAKIRRLKKRRKELANRRMFYKSNFLFRWIFNRRIEDINRLIISINVDVMLTGIMSIAKVFEISNSIKDLKKRKTKNAKK